MNPTRDAIAATPLWRWVTVATDHAALCNMRKKEWEALIEGAIAIARDSQVGVDTLDFHLE